MPSPPRKVAKKEPKPIPSPWEPASYYMADVAAVQALAQGKATDIQQKRAITWIIHDLCRTYDLSYRPNSERDTAFAEGKRYCGTQLVHTVNTPLGELKKNARS